MTASVVTPWPAPYAEAPVSGRVTVPGSKSITNRALLLAAIADSPSSIGRPLLARDTRLMITALRSLGSRRRPRRGRDRATVTPAPLAGPARVDCGLAGTVMRFVPPVAALATGRCRSTATRRPANGRWARSSARCASLGVRIEPGAASLPFTLEGVGAVTGGVVTIDASASSQFVSALLLAGATLRRGRRRPARRQARSVAPPHRDDDGDAARTPASWSTRASRTAGGSRRGRSPVSGSTSSLT